MAKINQYIDMPIGNLHIYVDPAEQARAEKLLRETPKMLTAAFRDAAHRWGDQVVREAIKCINQDTPPKGVSWPPLSEKYVKSHGIDNHHYLQSGQYIDSIGIYETGLYSLSGAKVRDRIYVGLPPAVKKTRPTGKDGKLTLQEVAKILESGTHDESIPPRPLWAPLYKRFGGQSSIKRYVINAIKRQIEGGATIKKPKRYNPWSAN